jgi:methylmalonyl-CoA epimerase
LIKRILEVGVAVKNIQYSGRQYQRVLGAGLSSVINVTVYDMLMQMCRIGNVDFELMEPVGKNGVIARFLKAHGEGLHHIAFEVDSILDSIDRMKEHNVRIINEQPILIDSLKAIFLHPGSFHGVLLELIEGKPNWVDDHVLPSELQNGKGAVCAEGVLEIGIIVQDLEAALTVYETKLSAQPKSIQDSNTFNGKLAVMQIGNVFLKLLELQKNSLISAGGFRNKKSGLYYIMLKVKSIGDAVRYLKQNAIQFSEGLSEESDLRVVAIDPSELNGISVRLTEQSDFLEPHA